MKIRSLLLAALVGLSSTIAVAQTAAIDAATQQQLDNAIAQGNTAQIAQIAAANPQAAVTIAQRVANAAQAAVATNPVAAATLAAAATTIVTQPAVTAAVSSNAAVATAVGNVASTATAVVAAPSVKAAVTSSPAVAAAVNTVTSNASQVATNPSVAAANPGAVTNITNNIANSNTSSSSNLVVGDRGNPTNQIDADAVSGGGGSE